MPESEVNTNGYTGKNQDEERDMAAKGGPTTTLGNPSDKHGISAPYDADLQTQIAAKSTNKPDKKNDTEE